MIETGKIISPIALLTTAMKVVMMLMMVVPIQSRQVGNVNEDGDDAARDQ
jgi:hypothetical protein